MSLPSAIVDVLRRLVGLTREPPTLPVSEAPIVEEAAAADTDADAPADDDDDDDIADAWADLQAFVARCEAEAIELASLDLSDPRTYWRCQRAIDGAVAGEREAAACAAGFADLAHWEAASRYYRIQWSELVEDGERLEIRTKSGFDEV